MQVKMFKSKIHRATITGADLNYEGSIKIDSNLLYMANMYEYEAVWIWNINNGERLMTYIIEGESDSGVIELNGAAARLGQKGDLIIITTFADMETHEAEKWKPTVVLVDEKNKFKKRFNQSGGVDGASL
jgi:aspartate 1-decarboxylase